MKKVLVVAYYTPPLGMSGVMRVTKLVKFLPRFGWQPIVLTVRRIAYYHYDERLLDDWQGIAVYRAQSLDPARLRYLLMPRTPVRSASSGHPGRLSNILCFPDAKAGWCPFAVGLGEKIIREEKPAAIFATAPPFSSLVVGIGLKRFSGLPLITDFRDPWPTGFVPPPRWLKPRVGGLRSSVLRLSDAVLAVNQGTASFLEGRAEIIENGYDPDEFTVPPRKLEGFGVLYVGNVWENEDEFLTVVKATAGMDNVRIRLVGGLNDALRRRLAEHRHFEWLGVIGHADTLAAMKGADLLLYLAKPDQAAGMKLYEYLGAGRPILSVSGSRTEADDLIEKHRCGVAIPNLPERIRQAVECALTGRLDFTPVGTERYSRINQARQVAEILERLTDSPQA